MSGRVLMMAQERTEKSLCSVIRRSPSGGRRKLVIGLAVKSNVDTDFPVGVDRD